MRLLLLTLFFLGNAAFAERRLPFSADAPFSDSELRFDDDSFRTLQLDPAGRVFMKLVGVSEKVEGVYLDNFLIRPVDILEGESDGFTFVRTLKGKIEISIELFQTPKAHSLRLVFTNKATKTFHFSYRWRKVSLFKDELDKQTKELDAPTRVEFYWISQDFDESIKTTWTRFHVGALQIFQYLGGNSFTPEVQWNPVFYLGRGWTFDPTLLLAIVKQRRGGYASLIGLQGSVLRSVTPNLRMGPMLGLQSWPTYGGLRASIGAQLQVGQGFFWEAGARLNIRHIELGYLFIISRNGTHEIFAGVTFGL